jgi:hypothetical protein
MELQATRLGLVVVFYQLLALLRWWTWFFIAALWDEKSYPVRGDDSPLKKHSYVNRKHAG